MQEVFDKMGVMKTGWSSGGFMSGDLYGFGCVEKINFYHEPHESGMFMDERKIACDMNDVDHFLTIGAESGGWAYCNTCVKDKNRPHGYKVFSGMTEIKLDKVEWIPRDEIIKYAMKEFKKEFRKITKMSKEVYYKECKNGNTDDAHYVFWNPDSKIGARAFRLMGPYKDEESHYSKGTQYVYDAGLIKKEMTPNQSGIAQSGRRSGWGNRYTLSKSAELIPSKIIMAKAIALMQPLVEDAFLADKQKPEIKSK